MKLSLLYPSIVILIKDDNSSTNYKSGDENRTIALVGSYPVLIYIAIEFLFFSLAATYSIPSVESLSTHFYKGILNISRSGQ